MGATLHVIGSLMIDRVLRVRVLPSPGETITARSAAVYPGGKGANQAVAAARCGARVRMLGRTGREGEFIVREPERACGIGLGRGCDRWDIDRIEGDRDGLGKPGHARCGARRGTGRPFGCCGCRRWHCSGAIDRLRQEHEHGSDSKDRHRCRLAATGRHTNGDLEPRTCRGMAVA